MNKKEALEFLKEQIKGINDFIANAKPSYEKIKELSDRRTGFEEVIKLVESEIK